MGILDQIIKMRKGNNSDQEIVSKLQEQGIPPKAINDALNQAEIKQAVSDNGEEYNDAPMPNSPPQGNYVPKTQEMEEEIYSPQQPQEEYYPQQPYSQYPEQSQQQSSFGQGGYESSYQQGATDTSTIIEVSEQVFLEKSKKMQKQVDEFTEFKILSDSKINNISERLKKIESVIDKLQMAILDKVGNYGKNLDEVKKEVSMMQDSFGKMVNNIADRKSENISRSIEQKSKKNSKSI